MSKTKSISGAVRGWADSLVLRLVLILVSYWLSAGCAVTQPLNEGPSGSGWMTYNQGYNYAIKVGTSSSSTTTTGTLVTTTTTTTHTYSSENKLLEGSFRRSKETTTCDGYEGIEDCGTAVQTNPQE